MKDLASFSARARPSILGSGLTAYTWSGTGQTVVSARAVNKSVNENWQYQRRAGS